jgi:hypothetical protein
VPKRVDETTSHDLSRSAGEEKIHPLPPGTTDAPCSTAKVVPNQAGIRFFCAIKKISIKTAYWQQTTRFSATHSGMVEKITGASVRRQCRRQLLPMHPEVSGEDAAPPTQTRENALRIIPLGISTGSE